MEWVKAPIPKRDVDGLWSCPKRKYNRKCGESLDEEDEEDDNSTSKIDPKDFRNPFHDVLDTENLWIWQVSILTILYYLIYRYDTMLAERAKRKTK